MFDRDFLEEHVDSLISKQIEEKKQIIVDNEFPWVKGNKKDK